MRGTWTPAATTGTTSSSESTDPPGVPGVPGASVRDTTPLIRIGRQREGRSPLPGRRKGVYNNAARPPRGRPGRGERERQAAVRRIRNTGGCTGAAGNTKRLARRCSWPRRSVTARQAAICRDLTFTLSRETRRGVGSDIRRTRRHMDAYCLLSGPVVYGRWYRLHISLIRGAISR
jgi:hypothetical protein